jgi:hypothetical protein
MQLLLLFIGENQKFEQNQLKSILQKNSEVKNLKTGNFVGSILECDFSYESDFTIVRLSDDLETITISGTGDASLKIALEIQKSYPKPIRVIDSDYNFDLQLQEISSVSEFRQKILEASSAQLPVR